MREFEWGGERDRTTMPAAHALPVEAAEMYPEVVSASMFSLSLSKC